jgi:4-oxalocrotonate tautomerase
MPIVQISMVEGRSREQLRNLIREVTNSVASTLEAPIDSIKVIVSEVPPTHWGSAGLTIADRRNQKI